MNSSITTDIGKIYCRYNEETEDFEKYRLIGVVEKESNKFYTLEKLNSSYILTTNEADIEVLNEDEFNEIKKEYTLLRSEGIVSCTNVVSMRNDHNEIDDVILIYFPNNKMTGVPDAYNPYIVARQGAANVFAEMMGYVDEVGASVSLDTLPVGYALSDFMENIEVIDSHLCHVYKTDTSENLAILLDNADTDRILRDLHDHRIDFLRNTRLNFAYEETEDHVIDGYCNSLRKFIEESDFINDLIQSMGIIRVSDLELQEGKPLSREDIILVSTLYGGLRIAKAVPLAFDYDIDFGLIKMKYLLIKDRDDKLWIVPYTEYDNEIDIDEMYKLTEEQTIKLQERLSKSIRAYEQKEEDTLLS